MSTILAGLAHVLNGRILNGISLPLFVVPGMIWYRYGLFWLWIAMLVMVYLCALANEIIWAIQRSGGTRS